MPFRSHVVTSKRVVVVLPPLIFLSVFLLPERRFARFIAHPGFHEDNVERSTTNVVYHGLL